MLTPQIKSFSQVLPQIYAYTTPGVTYHEGYIKIGYTERYVQKRIKEQTHTADVHTKLEWQGNAIFDDGSGQVFTDKAFHAYLYQLGVERLRGDIEWFHLDKDTSRNHFNDFRQNRGILDELNTVIPYTLRPEQEEAVQMTLSYWGKHHQGEFLWNAKPRFGKTLASYDLLQRMQAKKVLILTNRPAIANSWLSDYCKFLGSQSGWYFVSQAKSVNNKLGCLDWELYEHRQPEKFICFVSLQDLKGSYHFGGVHDKLDIVSRTSWDLLIIDEAHEGVDTLKTDIAFDKIERAFTLHLSGTPFKALASGKFSSEAIFNWTYADEQERKQQYSQRSAQSDYFQDNPYAELPQLHMYTYRMSEIVRDKLSLGLAIEGRNEEYAFDLNEFFRVDASGRFVHDSAVDAFLEALVSQEKFPFSTPELRSELSHTFWLLSRIDSVKALAEKLRNHRIFGQYQLVLAVGKGKQNQDDVVDNVELTNAFERVKDAIKKYGKTITLSVGQLTTGITVPEWSAVLMLSNIKSPALYMQAAFRAQNPCLFGGGVGCYRKTDAYVFDFDPARTLDIFEQFANNLYPETATGGGTEDSRECHIKELLNFFPVIAEDDEGKLVELDARQVLSIPRKIRAAEVVKRGFMSNFLFQNISNVFQAPQCVLDTIGKLQALAEPKASALPDEIALSSFPLDDGGNVFLDDDYLEEKTERLLGEKIYGTVVQEALDNLDEVVAQAKAEFRDNDAHRQTKREIERLRSQLMQDVIVPAQVNTVKEISSDYGDAKITKSDVAKIRKQVEQQAERRLARIQGEHQINCAKLEKARAERQQSEDADTARLAEDEEKFACQWEEERNRYESALRDIVAQCPLDAAKQCVEFIEKKRLTREKDDCEDKVRDHLRGFSRSIPAFLMAYGNEQTKLDNFDTVVPAEVFLEVTGITLEEFRFLRDGGDYRDENSGELRHYEGHLFDQVVFDDAVQDFLHLKDKLADYFEASSQETIFDYIPPQKTNQIFTPQSVVKNMVDLLEQENPGCFDNPEFTFIDVYMKSGMYIAEIVKRLYRSSRMQSLFPNRTERLRHIFAKQIYGLAPTEIIYRIVLNYVLGFAEADNIKREGAYNLRLEDALPYAQKGTLEQELERIFG